MRHTFFIGSLVISNLVLLSGCDIVGNNIDPKQELEQQEKKLVDATAETSSIEAVEYTLSEGPLEMEKLVKQEQELMALISEKLKHTIEEKAIFEKKWFEAVEKSTISNLEDSVSRLQEMRQELDASEESRIQCSLNEFRKFMIHCPGGLSDLNVVKEVVRLFTMLCTNIKEQMKRKDEEKSAIHQVKNI